MSLTPEEAIDEIMALFKAGWDAGSVTITAVTISEPPFVDWPDVAGDVPPSEGPWARIRAEHTDGSQRTLAPAGSRKFERLGLVTVQVFAPAGRGSTLGLQLGNIALNCFEGVTTAGGIWFRNAALKGPLPRKDQYAQVNVTADFVYDVHK